MKTHGWIPVTGLLLVSVLTLALPPVAAAEAPADETPGADLFVMPREAVLREKPTANARILTVLPAGTRLKLVAPGERYLQVDVATSPKAGGPAAGYVAREVTALFPDGAQGTRDLVTVGRKAE